MDMTGAIILIILIVAYAVLQIALLFRLWKMIDDVKVIRRIAEGKYRMPSFDESMHSTVPMTEGAVKTEKEGEVDTTVISIGSAIVMVVIIICILHANDIIG